MLRINFKIFISVVLGLFFLHLLLIPASASAQDDSDSGDNSSEKTGSSVGANNPISNLTDLGTDTDNTTDLGLNKNLGEIMGMVIQAALALVGMIFLILMIYAGYLWMTASGNQEQAEKARSIITMAVTGLVVVMAAYAVTVFVSSGLGSPVPSK